MTLPQREFFFRNLTFAAEIEALTQSEFMEINHRTEYFMNTIEEIQL